MLFSRKRESFDEETIEGCVAPIYFTGIPMPFLNKIEFLYDDILWIATFKKEEEQLHVRRYLNTSGTGWTWAEREKIASSQLKPMAT